jgi:hypothetical protein
MSVAVFPSSACEIQRVRFIETPTAVVPVACRKGFVGHDVVEISPTPHWQRILFRRTGRACGNFGSSVSDASLSRRRGCGSNVVQGSLMYDGSSKPIRVHSFCKSDAAQRALGATQVVGNATFNSRTF